MSFDFSSSEGAKISKGVWITLGFLLMVGLWLRWDQISYGLPAARYPDSAKTVSVGLKLSNSWRNHEWILDPMQYQYPTLYPNLLALLYYVRPHSMDVDEIGRATTMIFGWLLIPVLFFISYRLGTWRSALATAFFVSAGFFFVEQGRLANPDAVQAFFMTLALACWFFKNPLNKKMAFLSGVCSGLATGTKYLAFLLLFAFVIVYLFGPLKEKNWNKVIAFFGMWILGTGIGFFISTPTFFPHFSDYWTRLRLESQLQKAGAINEEATIGSLVFSQQMNPNEAPAENSMVGVLGWPLTLTALIALAWAGWIGWRKKREDLFALFVSVLVYWGFFLWSSRIQAVRFLLPCACVLVFLSSLFLEKVAEQGSHFFKNRGSVSTGVLLGCFVSLLLLPNFVTIVNYQMLMRKTDTRLLTVQWMLNHVPPGAHVLNFMYGPALPYGRYQIDHWQGPQFSIEVDKNHLDSPTLTELAHQKVEWVIWNHFYRANFFAPAHDVETEKIFSSWRRLYRDLKESTEERVIFEGNIISPTIEIFQLKGN